MGLGTRRPDGTYEPITPFQGSWAQTVNQPIPEHVRRAFNDRFAATHSQRLVIGTMTHQEYLRLKGISPRCEPPHTV